MANLPTLPFPNFVAGTPAAASQVNANNAALRDFFDGNLNEENFDTLGGTLNWAISGSIQALTILNTSTGADSALSGTFAGTLASGKSMLKLSTSAAQLDASNVSGLFIESTNASADAPLIELESAGPAPLLRGLQDGIAPFLQLKDSANDLWELEHLAAGEVRYKTFNSDSHRFEGGKVQLGDISGPLLSQNGAGDELFLESSLRIGDASDGPILSRGDADRLDISTELSIAGSATVIESNGGEILFGTGAGGSGGIVRIGSPTGPTLRQGTGSLSLQLDSVLLLTASGPFIESFQNSRSIAIRTQDTSSIRPVPVCGNQGFTQPMYDFGSGVIPNSPGFLVIQFSTTFAAPPFIQLTHVLNTAGGTLFVTNITTTEFTANRQSGGSPPFHWTAFGNRGD